MTLVDSQVFTGGEVDRADTEEGGEDVTGLISPTPPIDEAMLGQTTVPEVGGGEAVTSLVTSPVTSLFIYEMSNGILTTKGFISTTPDDDDQVIGR